MYQLKEFSNATEALDHYIKNFEKTNLKYNERPVILSKPIYESTPTTSIDSSTDSNNKSNSINSRLIFPSVQMQSFHVIPYQQIDYLPKSQIEFSEKDNLVKDDFNAINQIEKLINVLSNRIHDYKNEISLIDNVNPIFNKNCLNLDTKNQKDLSLKEQDEVQNSEFLKPSFYSLPPKLSDSKKILDQLNKETFSIKKYKDTISKADSMFSPVIEIDNKTNLTLKGQDEIKNSTILNSLGQKSSESNRIFDAFNKETFSLKTFKEITTKSDAEVKNQNDLIIMGQYDVKKSKLLTSLPPKPSDNKKKFDTINKEAFSIKNYKDIIPGKIDPIVKTDIETINDPVLKSLSKFEDLNKKLSKDVFTKIDPILEEEMEMDLFLKNSKPILFNSKIEVPKSVPDQASNKKPLETNNESKNATFKSNANQKPKGKIDCVENFIKECMKITDDMPMIKSSNIIKQV